MEHIMVVEIKIATEKLGMAQRDTLSVLNATFDEAVAVDGTPIKVKSRPGYISKNRKKIAWHGIHLVRVPWEHNDDGPFWWDNNPIEPAILADVLSFVRDPRRPIRKLDIDRRHKSGRLYLQSTLEFGDI